MRNLIFRIACKMGFIDEIKKYRKIGVKIRRKL